jgi:LysM repeat protein
MKKLLGNSCAKGCLAYFVAFVIVLALTAMGLGGLRGKFSTDVQNSPPQASSYSAQGQIANAPPAEAVGNTGSGSSSAASNQAQSPQAPIQPLATPTPVPSKPQIQIQVQAGGIKGEASLPFYIVQPNDTLWSIAQGFNVQVDALRVVNSLRGDLIKPGQTLYLPQIGQTQQSPQSQPPTQQPQSPPAANPPAQQAPPGQPAGSDMPTMPQTGINNKP